MPRTGRKRNGSAEPAAATAFQNTDQGDEVSRRRLRNRLSQRHFRERKSMYIKQLEERLQAVSHTESERNRALTQEVAKLRNALLSVRSQVLKVSGTFTQIGTEVGRIMNVQSSEDMDDENHGGEQIARESTAPLRSRPSRIRRVSKDSRPARAIVIDGSESSTERSVTPPGSISQTLPTAASVLACNTPVESINVEEVNINSSDMEYLDPGHLGNAEEAVVSDFDPANHSYSQIDSTIFPDVLADKLHSDYLDAEPPHELTVAEPRDNGMESLLPENHIASMPFTLTPSQTCLTLPSGHLPTSRADVGQSMFPKQLSMFSEHVETLELQARHQLDGAPDKATRQKVYQYCSAIMSLFVKYAWPQTSSVWFNSQVTDIIGPVLLWRIHPTNETYGDLLPDYRPTALQLSVPHSAVIDWFPYGALRDRIITFYNRTANLDRLLSDFITSYVIEVDDLSRALPGAPPERVYFGIWNMFSAIDAIAVPSKHSFQVGQSLPLDAADHAYRGLVLNDFLPTPLSQIRNLQSSVSLPDSTLEPYNLREILKTPASLLKLAYDIRLYAAKAWRIDPALFEKWPELKFEGYQNVVAIGRSCRISMEPPDGPKQMTPSVIEAYQRAIQDLT